MKKNNEHLTEIAFIFMHFKQFMRVIVMENYSHIHKKI